jgi:hypothetical protein
MEKKITFDRRTGKHLVETETTPAPVPELPPVPVAEPTKAATEPAAKKRKGKPTEKKSEPVEQNNQKSQFVNAYSFLHLKEDQLKALDVVKGVKTAVKVEIREGTLVIRKVT